MGGIIFSTGALQRSTLHYRGVSRINNTTARSLQIREMQPPDLYVAFNREFTEAIQPAHSETASTLDPGA